ncbi:hypothetical protein OHA72_47550 [Dactylosporangium sp. NBC_01737]|uniref:hypothetical protein n=1 Tax=Dactylosporangium sp. NBC_01737 TaxID=2975959 RepID=UPI002E11F016|nr:hypothetical protein OHA72_47550 [Dactylosporangium sp. NBC_01737]
MSKIMGRLPVRHHPILRTHGIRGDPYDERVRKLLGMLCGLSLLVVAGCGDEATPTAKASSSSSAATSAAPPASPPPSPSPSSSAPVDPAVAANTRQVCDELKKVNFDQTAAFISGLSKHGDIKAITDPAKQQAIMSAAKNGLTAWATTIRPIAAKAINPALRKAIDDHAAALDDTAATLRTFDQVTSVLVAPPIAVAERETREICG